MTWALWTGVLCLIAAVAAIVASESGWELIKWGLLQRAARAAAEGADLMNEPCEVTVKIPAVLFVQFPNEWELSQQIEKRLREGGIDPSKPFSVWVNEMERLHYYRQTEQQREAGKFGRPQAT